MIYDAFGFSSNYPKMWFYLSLRLVYTCLLGLVKSLSCFCVVFKVHLLVLFPHYFVASSSPSVDVLLMYVSVRLVVAPRTVKK